MRRLTDQRGAVAVIAAISMVALVGFAAISVDVGALWWDKKELQNGADAGALALAQSCAESSCEPDEFAVAGDYARGNKSDDLVTVSDIDHDTNSVTVRLESDREHWFAPVLGLNSSRVSASATAVWDGIGGAPVLPFTVSDCALGDIETGTTVRFELKDDAEIPKKPSKTDPAPEDPATCPVYSSGPHVIPGGFGWLVVADEDHCLANTSLSDGAPSDPGLSGPQGVYECDQIFQALETYPDGILIPLYEHASGQGAGATYTIIAYAHLIVDRYCLSEKGQGWLYPDEACKKADPKDPVSGRYIEGRFVSRVALNAVDGGGDVGSKTVKLILTPEK